MEAMNAGLQRTLDVVLRPGERVEALERSGILPQKWDRKRAGRNVGLSLLLTIPLSRLGVFALVSSAPGQVWVVITSDRLLLVGRPRNKGAGDLVYENERRNLRAQLEGRGWKHRVVVTSTTQDVDVLNLSFGPRKVEAARTSMYLQPD